MEQFGVNMSEDPPKGNVRGNAIRHLQKHLQSDLFAIAELRNRDLVVDTADHGAHGDNGEILSRLQSLLRSIRGSSAVTK